jgi:hypothetical protein
MFTQGQVARMQAALDGARSTIGTTGPCVDKSIPDEVVKPIPLENVKDVIKDRPKEVVKERPKDLGKDIVKENPKEFVKENPKDFQKEFPKDGPKDQVKEGPKDGVFDPKGVVEQPGFPEGPIIQPGQPGVQPGLGGQLPFVLGGPTGRAEPAAAVDPLLPVVQQLGVLLSSYAAAAQQGGLGARDAMRWQQLSSVYAQLVAMLG